MDDSPETPELTPSQASGSYYMVMTPGKDGWKKEEEKEKKEKAMNHKENRTQQTCTSLG